MSADATQTRRLIVHMGVQKTGSTSLHHFLQVNRERLAPALTVLTPKRGTPTRDMGRAAALYSVHLDEVHETRLSEAITTVKDQIDTFPGTCLISHENLPGAMIGRAGTVTLYPHLDAILARRERDGQQRQDHVALPAIYALGLHLFDIRKDQNGLHPFHRSAPRGRLVAVFPAEPVDQQREAAALRLPGHLGDREHGVLGQRRNDTEILGIHRQQPQRPFAAVFETCVFHHQSFTRSITAPTPRSLRTTCS